MKKYSKSFKVKVTSLSTGNVYYTNSICQCADKLSVSEKTISKIKSGQRSSFVTDKNGKIWNIEFIPDLACILYPAWDNRLDSEPICPKECSSHAEAIQFLSGLGPSKKSTYIRRMNMQPLGEPCNKPIMDNHGYEWIVTFYKPKGTFVPNKKIKESK